MRRKRKYFLFLLPFMLFSLASITTPDIRSIRTYSTPLLVIVDHGFFDGPERIAEKDWRDESHLSEWAAWLPTLTPRESDLLPSSPYAGERLKRSDILGKQISMKRKQVDFQRGAPNISIAAIADGRIMLLSHDIHKGFISAHQETTPIWMFWVAGIAVLIVVLLVFFIRYLRQQVARQTEKLYKSREELALIIDRISSMIAFVDCNQRYIYVDESYANWYGFHKKAVVGKLVSEVLSPENYAKVHPHIEEMLASGKELKYEYSAVRRNGKIADVAVSYIPNLDSNGNVVSFFATVREITEEKTAVMALQESELKYRSLVDNSLIGVYIIQRGKIVFANRGLAELFGYEGPEEMFDLDVQQIVFPQDWEFVKNEIQTKEMSTKRKSQHSFKALRVDGGIINVEVISESIQYAGEMAIQGMLIDITDRVEAEERFRSLSEAAYEALFISEKGLCLEQNTAAERMFGYTLAEAVGRFGTDWIAPEDRDLVMHHMLSGYEEPYRAMALRKDGSTFPAEIVGRMMQYRGRKVRVTALRDISSQIAAEEELRASEERYRSIVQDNQAVMLLINSSSGNIIEANAAASSFYGWTQEELQRKNISEINLLDDEAVYVEMQRAKERRKNQFFFKHRLASGEVRDVEVHSTRISLYDIEVLHSIVHDISDRVKAEKALRESHERFEKVIAGIPVPMVITDSQGDIEFYNNKFIEIFGYTLDDIRLRKDWWDRVYPDEEYRARVQTSWGDAIAYAEKTGTQIATQTWDMVCKNGDIRTVEFDMMPIGDISVIAMSDITERIQSERIRREREEKLKEAQEIGNMGHWELDLLTDELIWSEQIFRIFRVDPKTFQSSYGAFLEVIHPDDREMVGDAYSTSLESKTPYDITHRLLLAGNEVRYVRERCKTEYAEDGTPLRSLGTVQDITEQVRDEQVMNVRAELAEYAITHSLEELLRKTLDEAENLTDSKIGFYHFVNQDQKSLTLQQWSTRTVESYCVVENLNRHYPIERAGVWVDCIEVRTPVIHNDYATLEHRKGLPEGHSHLVRELVVPVIRGEKVVAILGVGNKATLYDEQDVEIVSLVADLCWEIAKRKLTEEALGESEAFLKQTQELARLGSYRLFVTSEQWTSNAVLDSIFGIDENYDRSTAGWLMLIHPDDQEMMQTYLTEEVLTARKSFDKEYRIVQPSTQQTCWVHGLGKLEYDIEGNLLSMVGTIQDITERVLADKLLQKSEARLRTLINATPDIICFKDGQGCWLATNNANLALFELTGVDYVGKKDSELAVFSDFYSDALLAIEATDEIAWQAGTLSRQEEVIPTSNEGDKVYDVIKVPLFNEDGSRQALVVLGRDITMQVAAQKELKKHTRQLEIVNAISAALSTSLALEDLLKTILQQVVQVISCDSASIFLAETDRKLLIVNAIGNAEKFVGQSFDVEETLMKKITSGKEVLILDDAINDPDFVVWENSIPFRGWMGLPLHAHDTLVGYLTFDSQQPQAYGSQDAALAVAFATQVAQAIYNARLYGRVIADANDLERHIQQRTAELQEFVNLTAGREIRMVELKNMIRELRTQLMSIGHVPVAGDSLDIT